MDISEGPGPTASLSLYAYRRRVSELYAEVRKAPNGVDTQRRWIQGRDELFARHPQSALDPESRASFAGLSYFPHDASYRFELPVESVDPGEVLVSHNGDGSTRFVRIGRVTAPLPEGEASLTLFWLDGYGGGLFVPFRDGTAGNETYGGGRYVLDSAKGADLGGSEDTVVIDFNYAYHPSCVYSDRWSCPLAPAENHTPLPIRARERLS